MASGDPKLSLDDELARTQGIERDLIAEVLQSRRRAWFMTIFFAVLALMGVAAVAALVPLKEPPELYVVRVDNATGSIEHVTHIRDSREDYGDRIARYFINQYVLACESYDWYTIQNTYNRCALLSAPDVQKAYFERFKGDDAVDKKYNKHSRVRIDVRSITLGPNQSATVRFKRRVENLGGQRLEEQDLIATLNYAYFNVDLSEAIARENPLGFQVMSYDTDVELTAQ